MRISWLASRFWEVGGLGTLVFGVWLAMDVDGYDLLDGWILGALVLWIVARAPAAGSCRVHRRGRRGRCPCGRRAAHGQHVVMTAATTLLLVDMICKPGA